MRPKIDYKLISQFFLRVALLFGIVFSLITIVRSAVLDPGHAWNTLDDAALPIANGGTGQTAANDAFNALVPSQTGNSGKFLTTDASNTSWDTPARTGTTTRVVFGGRSSASFSDDAYCHLTSSVCGSASETSLGTVIPFATTIKNLYGYMSAAQGSGDTCNFYVRKATGGCTASFSNTALTCSIANVSQACSDVTHAVEVSAGDCLQIYFDEAGGTCVGLLSWSFEAQY